MIQNLAPVLRLLHPGRRFALRLLDCGQDGTVAGTFDDPAVAAAAVARYDGVASACYVHLHELKPTVAVMNRLKTNVDRAIDRSYIARYRWLLVDLDPARLDPLTGEVLPELDAQGRPVIDGRGQPKKLKSPSTAGELANALDRRDQVVAFLVDRGFPVPLTGMSGNGGHALFALDLPNDDEAKKIVAQVLQTLDLLFTGAGVEVDTSVFDPARIVKLYGTLAKKGRAFDDRPFRRSYLDDPPPVVEAVPLFALKALVKEYEVDKTVVDLGSQKAVQAALTPQEGQDDEDNASGLWYDLADLKDRADIVEVARRLGLDPKEEGESNWVAYCPAHPDRRTGRPNLVIRPDLSYADGEGRAKCYRCDWHGDAIDLVEAAKGMSTKDAIRWLADVVGLKPTVKPPPRVGNLGYDSKGKKAKSYPNTDAQVAPPGPDLPPARSPVLGNDNGVKVGEAYPNADRLTLVFPADAQVATVAGHWRRLEDGRIEATYSPEELDFLLASGLVVAQGLQEAPGRTKRPSLRVRVYESLLKSCTPIADFSRAADWLKANWGLSVETLTRFGVAWLADPDAAGRQLKTTFGEDVLRHLHLLTKSGDLVFGRHRLVFPFWLTVDGRRFPVYAQGRDPQAKDKAGRFVDPGGPPVPYNVDALDVARRRRDPVFVCEGITDTLTLTQSGRLAVGTIGTQGFNPEWVGHFEGLDVYLAFDGDEAGRKAGQTVAALFVDRGLPPPLVVALPDGQDVTDFFRSNPPVVTPPVYY